MTQLEDPNIKDKKQCNFSNVSEIVIYNEEKERIRSDREIDLNIHTYVYIYKCIYTSHTQTYM